MNPFKNQPRCVLLALSDRNLADDPLLKRLDHISPKTWKVQVLPRAPRHYLRQRDVLSILCHLAKTTDTLIIHTDRLLDRMTLFVALYFYRPEHLYVLSHGQLFSVNRLAALLGGYSLESLYDYEDVPISPMAALSHYVFFTPLNLDMYPASSKYSLVDPDNDISDISYIAKLERQAANGSVIDLTLARQYDHKLIDSNAVTQLTNLLKAAQKPIAENDSDLKTQNQIQPRDSNTAQLKQVATSQKETARPQKQAAVVKTMKVESAPNQLQPLTRRDLPVSQISTPNGAILRPYQTQLVNFIMARKRTGLFVDMGLGKTLTVLAAIDRLVKSGKLDPSRPILIVAPIMVALDTWSREAEKWGYDYQVLINIKLKSQDRLKLYQKLLQPMKKVTLVTTNPAQLTSLNQFLRAHHALDRFQMIIVDELSQFKSVSTKRFKDLKTISQYSDYFIGLTGTPAPNNLLDLYSEIILINAKYRAVLGSQFSDYQHRYFAPSRYINVRSRHGMISVGTDYRLKAGCEQLIYQAIRDDVISLQTTGLIDLPKIVFSNYYVSLPAKAQKLYNSLACRIKAKILQEQQVVVSTAADKSFSVANAAVLTSKLLQLSSGAIYDEELTTDAQDQSVCEDRHTSGVAQDATIAVNDGKPSEFDTDNHRRARPYTVFQDEKFKMLKDIVETSDSPVLVFFEFGSELERMRQYFDFEYLDTKDKVKAKDLIRRWNLGQVPVLVAHPQAAGHGLNLQDGGHIMIWLTMPWSNEQYRQAVKRLYRSGQKYPVSVIHIIARQTIDEQVLDSLTNKESGQIRLLDALA